MRGEMESMRSNNNNSSISSSSASAPIIKVVVGGSTTTKAEVVVDEVVMHMRRQYYFDQMPVHYPRYTKADYETMPEWRLDYLLQQYGLPIIGDVPQRRNFAMGAFLWPH